MNLCELHNQYIFNLKCLTRCSSAKAYVVVNELVESGIDIAVFYEKQHNVLLQELY